MPSTRSKRQLGGNSNKSGFFNTAQDPSDQYQIQVTKDGSMITAVPIAAVEKSSHNLRSSPILFSDARALSDGPVVSQQIVSKKQWSRQGLLEARGKQRVKLKNRSDGYKKSNSSMSIPFKPVNKSSSSSGGQRKEKRREKVRWDLTQLNSEERKQPHSLKAGQLFSEKRDDESFSSFPILSPTHKFDDSGSSMRQTGREPAVKPQSVAQNGHVAMHKPKSSGNEPTQSKAQSSNLNPSNTFQSLLQQRIAEIQQEKAQLLQSISKKEMIERTLISAIDENVIKNRKRIDTLNQELEEIQWHLSLSPKDGERKMLNGSSAVAAAAAAAAAAGAKQSNTASTPRGNISPTQSVGDPSLTMIDSATGSILSARDEKRMLMKKSPIVTGLDPPARPSPVHPAKKQVDPTGPRISNLLHGDELPLGFHDLSLQQMPIRPIRPVPKHLGNVQRGRQSGVRPQQNASVYARQQQQQRASTLQRRPNNPLPSRSRIRSAFRNTANKRGLKKNVHFNLPDEESVELKFVKNDSPSVDDFNVPLQHAPLGNFAPGTNNGNHSNYDDEIRSPSQVDQVDDQSWQGSQYDVDTYDEATGALISSEHYDTFQWRDNNHHIVNSEHYSSENHHHAYGTEPQSSSAFKQYHRNSGVSSNSVESDPDLSFIHAVAAVVIQTAVRRYLAEIRAMERLYAVQVIQTTICQWMARQTDPNLHAYRVVRKEVSHMPSPVRPATPTKMKRVVFLDQQSEVYHCNAINIQRCWRGWWAREGIEVDHYAAGQIQRVFRGWWQREALEVDRYCAIEIQRVIRGYLGRMSYIYDLYCVIVAQSVARRYLAFYESAIRLANVLYIQAIYRGYRVRSQLMRYVLQGQEVAATMIQSQYRSYDAQMNFINTLADILICQSVARRWLTLRKLKPVKLQYSYHHGIRRQQQVAYNIHNNSSVSRAIQNLQHYPVPRQHLMEQNGSTPTWRNSPMHPSPSRSPSNRPPRQQESNIRPDNHRPEYPTHREHQPDGFDTFNRGGSEEWYDGNKSEASEMLTNWKRRSSRSTNS